MPRKKKSEYYCPNCGADLMEQPGFDPNESYWTCTNCGTLLTNPDDSDMNNPSGIVWFCDCCGACLNKQIGFSETNDSWTCTECGHVNSLSKDNVYSSEEERENSVTHYYCPNCGSELNKQVSFYEDDEYTCESCGEELYKNGNEYEKKYICPHCGDTLNSQWSFNSFDDYYSCSNCGTQLHKNCDEYEEVMDDSEEVNDGNQEINDNSYEAPYYEEDEENDNSSNYVHAPVYSETARDNSYENKDWKWILISILLIFLGAVIVFGTYEYKKLISIEFDSESLVGKKYESVVSELKGKGFSNVEVKKVEDLNYEETNKEKTVKDITIQPILMLPFLQKDVFKYSDRFPYDSLITVKYHAMIKLVAPMSSKDAKKKNYEEVFREFKDAGFVNVKVQKHEDLIFGWINKAGTVEKVTIDGNSKFDDQDKYRPDAKIVIVYHTFKR